MNNLPPECHLLRNNRRSVLFPADFSKPDLKKSRFLRTSWGRLAYHLLGRDDSCPPKKDSVPLFWGPVGFQVEPLGRILGNMQASMDEASAGNPAGFYWVSLRSAYERK